MKHYSIEEAKELIPLRKGKHNWVYKKLMLLKVGEALGIGFSDWKTKSTPYATIRRAAKHLDRKFDYGHHPDGSGWLVKRVE